MRIRKLVVVLALAALGTGQAWADDRGEDCSLPWWKRWCVKRFKGEPSYGRGGFPHDFEHMGHPEQISKWAQPSETPNYIGYYVGGGCTFKGGPPGPAEGTYGWDYAGLCCHAKKIVLGFCHRTQGGQGPYKIDGPRTPDIGPYIEKLKEGPRHKMEHAEHESHEAHEAHEAHAEPVGHSEGGHGGTAPGGQPH